MLGAYGGEAGVIVALGTGSIAASLDAHGVCRISGGYGFPSGDEASGAWLGMRAAIHLQRVLDGRLPEDDWSRELLARTGATDRDSLVVWLCAANQIAYATLAPTVFEFRDHPFAAKLRPKRAARSRCWSMRSTCGAAAGRAVWRPLRALRTVRADGHPRMPARPARGFRRGRARTGAKGGISGNGDITCGAIK